MVVFFPENIQQEVRNYVESFEGRRLLLFLYGIQKQES
jgi:hypothetical protein